VLQWLVRQVRGAIRARDVDTARRACGRTSYSARREPRRFEAGVREHTEHISQVDFGIELVQPRRGDAREQVAGRLGVVIAADE
jgi:hypothetical protein